MTNYQLTNDIPTAQEYLALRAACGLSPRGLAASTQGLQNSVYMVCLRGAGDNRLIGMGRIVGDGGTAYQLTDIAVVPNYQGQGLGKVIMGHLMAFVDQKIDPLAYVSLIADRPADALYRQFGFVETAPDSLGMYLKPR